MNQGLIISFNHHTNIQVFLKFINFYNSASFLPELVLTIIIHDVSIKKTFRINGF
jgi:hypothetical protein